MGNGSIESVERLAMGTHQTQQQQQKQSSSISQLSLDDVSKFFNLPLSDAADTLGVCNSTLKRICQDNGLVRWPYRKFLSGKSIEDIIKEAAREREMKPAELLKATKDKNDDVTKITVPSIGSTLQNKTTIPVHDISKARSITHQQGTKNLQNATPAIVDEFKYGFPSDGLSRTSNKWWGSSTIDSKKDAHGKEDEDNQKSEKPLDDNLSKDKVDSQSGKDESNNVPELSGTGLLSTVRKRAVDEGRNVPELSGTGLLSTVRKRAVDEGREALKLGVHRFSGINKPGKREQRLLLGIFGSSLPKEWRDGSS